MSAGRYRAYPDYKDSGVEWLGEIPAHWNVEPFKRQIERNDGGVWGNDPDGKNDTIVLRSTDQTADGHWQLDDPAPRKLTKAEIEGALLFEGDLLLTKSSGSSLHIGKTTLVTAEVAALRCCYSNFMQRIRTKTTFLPKLAWYVLNNELARRQLDLLSNSTTGLANLNAPIVGQLLVICPPLPEQTKIAKFLDHETAKIDRLIEKQEALIRLLKEKRQAVISHAVTKGLNPRAPLKDSGIEWLGQVPAHWKVKPLLTVAGFEPGKAHEPFIDDDGAFVCVNSRFVSTNGESRKNCTRNITPARRHDILMVMSDLPNGRALAKAYFVQDESNLAVNQRVCAITAKECAARFLYYFLDRNAGLLLHDDGVSQTHLSNANYTKLPTLIPPKEEQIEIAAYLDRQTQKMDALIRKAESAISVMQERRTALISAAVSRSGKCEITWRTGF